MNTTTMTGPDFRGDWEPINWLGREPAKLCTCGKTPYGCRCRAMEHEPPKSLKTWRRCPECGFTWDYADRTNLAKPCDCAGVVPECIDAPETTQPEPDMRFSQEAWDWCMARGMTSHKWHSPNGLAAFARFIVDGARA